MFFWLPEYYFNYWSAARAETMAVVDCSAGHGDVHTLVPDARYRARTWLQLFSFLRKSGIGWYAFG